MKVSIITTCLNRENTIRMSIESVLAQDYPDVEYIVVDAASTDGTIDIINEYRDRIAKVICEPDNGMYEGINKGLRAATGDVIGLVHSDDFLYSPTIISKIVQRFKTTHCDMVYGNGQYFSNSPHFRIVRDWISKEYDRDKVKHGWLPLHPTVYVTKEWLNKCGLYDETFKIASDSDWLVRSLYDMTPSVSYINEYIVNVRMGGLSTATTNTRRKWAEDLRMYRKHGLKPYVTLTRKVLSKIPQFVRAKMK